MSKAQEIVKKIVKMARSRAHDLGLVDIDLTIHGWEVSDGNIHPRTINRAWEIMREKGYVLEGNMTETWQIQVNVPATTVARYREFSDGYKAMQFLAVKIAEIANHPNAKDAGKYVFDDQYYSVVFKFTEEELLLVKQTAHKQIVEKLKATGLGYLIGSEKIEIRQLGEDFIVTLSVTSSKLHPGDYQKLEGLKASLNSFVKVQAGVSSNFTTKIVSVPESLLELDATQISEVEIHVKKIIAEFERNCKYVDLSEPKSVDVFVQNGVRGTILIGVIESLSHMGYDVTRIHPEGNREILSKVRFNSIPATLLKKLQTIRDSEVWQIGTDLPIVDLQAHFDLPIRYMELDGKEHPIRAAIAAGRKVVFMSNFLIPLDWENITTEAGQSVWVVSNELKIVEYKPGQKLPVTKFKSHAEEGAKILLMHQLTESEKETLLNSDLLPHHFEASQLIQLELTDENQFAFGITADHMSASTMWYSLSREHVKVVVMKLDQIPPAQYDWWISMLRREYTFIVIEPKGSLEIK